MSILELLLDRRKTPLRQSTLESRFGTTTQAKSIVSLLDISRRRFAVMAPRARVVLWMTEGRTRQDVGRGTPVGDSRID